MNEMENLFLQWLIDNLFPLVITAIYALVGYALYRIIKMQLEKLEKKHKIKDRLASNITSISKWFIIFIVIGLSLGQFGVTLEWIAGIFSLFGGTILGFAAINTIGNAIAGVIVKRSKPFKAGDRVSIDGQLSDVLQVNLIYTKMVTMDRVIVSIPNQKLLKMKILNYGNNRMIRLHVDITAGYEVPFQHVENALLEATNQVNYIAGTPEPFVRIMAFLDFGIKYRVFVFTQDVVKINEILADLHLAVLYSCQDHGIDLSMPIMHTRVGGGTKTEANSEE
ncbi:mechanosensitive ion channel [Candidatus Bathyarchaeota archaeon]|nr:mechanosensitive ion channel [Candidatus Bathyarchaeota archaeon]